jgi:hypothetical protein
MSPSRARLFRVVLAVLALALLLSGCRSQPMMTPAPIPSQLGEQQNRLAILRGLTLKGWDVVSEAPGRITARQDRNDAGKYVATVDVDYDAENIAIRYRSSQGLSCEPAGDSCASIHRAYNRWVVQLAKNIEHGVEITRLESADSPAVGAGPR